MQSSIPFDDAGIIRNCCFYYSVASSFGRENRFDATAKPPPPPLVRKIRSSSWTIIFRPGEKTNFTFSLVPSAVSFFLTHVRPFFFFFGKGSTRAWVLFIFDIALLSIEWFFLFPLFAVEIFFFSLKFHSDYYCHLNFRNSFYSSMRYWDICSKKKFFSTLLSKMEI